MTTLTARLDDWLREAIVDFWKEHDAGPSSALRRVAEEWWAMNAFSRIRFRDGVSGRRAVLERGPDVWEVVSAFRAHGGNRDALREHFDLVDSESIDQALAYAERFPEEIDAWIAGNERLGRRLEAQSRA